MIHFPPGMEFLSGTWAKHQEGITDAQLFKVIVIIWQQIVSCPFGGLCDGYDCSCVESLVTV